MIFPNFKVLMNILRLSNENCDGNAIHFPSIRYHYEIHLTWLVFGPHLSVKTTEIKGTNRFFFRPNYFHLINFELMTLMLRRLLLSTCHFSQQLEVLNKFIFKQFLLNTNTVRNFEIRFHFLRLLLSL